MILSVTKLEAMDLSSGLMRNMGHSLKGHLSPSQPKRGIGKAAAARPRMAAQKYTVTRSIEATSAQHPVEPVQPDEQQGFHGFRCDGTVHGAGCTTVNSSITQDDLSLARRLSFSPFSHLLPFARSGFPLWLGAAGTPGRAGVKRVGHSKIKREAAGGSSISRAEERHVDAHDFLTWEGRLDWIALEIRPDAEHRGYGDSRGTG
ncbi:hypothetical protein B7463_g8450, partial [Scytalidium lignicola]